MMEKSALERVNQEMVNQPQSKLFAVVHICKCVQLPCTKRDDVCCVCEGDVCDDDVYGSNVHKGDVCEGDVCEGDV